MERLRPFDHFAIRALFAGGIIIAGFGAILLVAALIGQSQPQKKHRDCPDRPCEPQHII